MSKTAHLQTPVSADQVTPEPTVAIMDAMVGLIERGVPQGSAWETAGVDRATGDRWLWLGGRGKSAACRLLAERIKTARASWRRTRAEAIAAGSDPGDILDLGPVDLDENRTGLDLLAQRVPAARAALTGALDAASAAERSVQASMAALEIAADLLARREEIRPEDVKEFRAAIRDAGKLHEQLAGAEKNRAIARAEETVAMFVVAVVNLLARHITPDQLMAVRADLNRLPRVASSWDTAEVVDVTPAETEIEEPAS